MEFTQYIKSDKTLPNIYADVESVIKRLDGYKTNFEKLSIYSLWVFDVYNMDIWCYRK